MPILTLPLVGDGAVVDLLVGVSEPRRQALAGANQPVPTPVQLRALIDTGASPACVIEDSVIQSLGLVQTDDPKDYTVHREHSSSVQSIRRQPHAHTSDIDREVPYGPDRGMQESVAEFSGIARKGVFGVLLVRL